MFRNLSLKQKLILGFIGVCILPIAMYFAFTNYYLNVSFKNIKHEKIISKYQGFDRLEKNNLNNLLKVVRDYSNWDDLYENSAIPNDEWLEENVSNWIPENFNVDLIVGADRNGKIFYQFQMPEDFIDKITKENNLVNDLKNGEEVSGYISIENGIYQIAASPILKTDQTGPKRGFWLYGRLISDDALNSIKQIIGADIVYFKSDQVTAATNRDLFNDKMPLSVTNPKIYQSVLIKGAEYGDSTGKFLYHYSPLREINGSIIGIVAVIESAEDLSDIQNNIRSTSYAAITFCIVLSLFAVFYMVNAVRNPILELQNAMRIGKNDIPKKVNINTNDEIEDMANTFNKMVDNLSLYRDERNKLQSEADKNNLLLKEKIRELEKFKKLTIDRELKMIELKKKIRKHHG